MQLTHASLLTLACLCAGLLGVATVLRAQHRVAGSLATFVERRGPLATTVVAPSLSGEAAIDEHTRVGVEWSADVVSGASVAVVDAPGVDIVSSATRFEDERHALGAKFAHEASFGALRASYGYGFESDYRGHRIGVGARLDLAEKTTTIDVAWTSGFDEVCDTSENDGVAAAERARLSSSVGCFGGDLRADRSLRSQVVQVSLTRALRADLAAQVTAGVERLDGFQSSPYREVWLGPYAVQENHPATRTRGSLTLDLRLALPSLRAFASVVLRGYHDDWGIGSFGAELAWEQRLGASLRVRLRWRSYTQQAAAFFSDDYAVAQRGSYWTGDRELSALTSDTVGLRFAWEPTAATSLGPLLALRVSAALDVAQVAYMEFHYGRERMPAGAWGVGTVAIEGDL